ncbi:hypothetical protein NQZ68_027470 [Dissostichus eleginoides]|nr:hypothetical protein NQZ68_027470 [Dissostichus eleginoides]
MLEGSWSDIEPRGLEWVLGTDLRSSPSVPLHGTVPRASAHLSLQGGVAAVSHTRIRTAHLTAGAVAEKLLRWRLPWAQCCYHLTGAVGLRRQPQSLVVVFFTSPVVWFAVSRVVLSWTLPPF